MNVVDRWVGNFLLGRLESKIMLNGYKGYIGAVAAMLGAVAGAAHDFATGDYSMDKMLAYWSAFAIGFSAFGIRHAIAKAAV